MPPAQPGAFRELPPVVWFQPCWVLCGSPFLPSVALSPPHKSFILMRPSLRGFAFADDALGVQRRTASGPSSQGSVLSSTHFSSCLLSHPASTPSSPHEAPGSGPAPDPSSCCSTVCSEVVTLPWPVSQVLPCTVDLRARPDGWGLECLCYFASLDTR